MLIGLSILNHPAIGCFFLAIWNPPKWRCFLGPLGPPGPSAELRYGIQASLCYTSIPRNSRAGSRETRIGATTKDGWSPTWRERMSHLQNGWEFEGLKRMCMYIHMYIYIYTVYIPYIHITNHWWRNWWSGGLHSVQVAIFSTAS